MTRSPNRVQISGVTPVIEFRWWCQSIVQASEEEYFNTNGNIIVKKYKLHILKLEVWSTYHALVSLRALAVVQTVYIAYHKASEDSRKTMNDSACRMRLTLRYKCSSFKKMRNCVNTTNMRQVADMRLLSVVRPHFQCTIVL